MQRVVNTKIKLAFKLDEHVDLKAEPGDRLLVDQTSERGYVAYVVPRARFKQDFEEYPPHTTGGGGIDGGEEIALGRNNDADRVDP